MIGAVNRKIGGSGGGAFERDEAVKALKEMDAKNQIMYVSPLCSFLYPFYGYVSCCALFDY